MFLFYKYCFTSVYSNPGNIYYSTVTFLPTPRRKKARSVPIRKRLRKQCYDGANSILNISIKNKYKN